jgi:hypothetical protein
MLFNPDSVIKTPVPLSHADVPCDLRVKQYYMLITNNRPKCWQRIAAQIQASNFAGQ